jgi:hypothetical protein
VLCVACWSADTSSLFSPIDATLAEDIASTGTAFRPWQRAPQRLSTRPEDDLLKDWE